MVRKKWIIALVAAACLVACGVVGVRSFAKTADPMYPEDAENAMNVSGDGEPKPSELGRPTSEQEEEQQYLGGMSETSQGANSPRGLKSHTPRHAQASSKTASAASAQAASTSYLGSYRWWRRAFGPLFGWWLLLVPAAAAFAALVWITSLVARKRLTRGVPPLVVFDLDDGPAAAPRRRDDRPRRAA